MSIRLVKLVLEKSPLRGMPLMAEVRLAEYVNDENDFDPITGAGECYPSLAKLAPKVGVKKRQMIEIVKEAERSGEIQILRTSGRGNRYRIVPGGGAAKSTGAENRTSATERTIPVQPSAPDQCSGAHQTGAVERTLTQEENTGTEIRKETQEGRLPFAGSQNGHISERKPKKRSRSQNGEKTWPYADEPPPDWWVASCAERNVDPIDEWSNWRGDSLARRFAYVDWHMASLQRIRRAADQGRTISAKSQSNNQSTLQRTKNLAQRMGDPALLALIDGRGNASD